MKGKVLLVLCTILTFSFNVFAQTDSTSVSFVSYWSIGDSYDFKVKKIEQRWKEGKQVKNKESQYLANFTVIDSTASSYTISWKYENELINNYDFPKELKEKFADYELTDIRYKTTELGEFVEIINWKEISEKTKSMIDDVVDVLGADDKTKKEALKKAMEVFKNMYSSKEGIEQLVLKELQYFHFPLGYEFEINEPLTYVDNLPSMIGGEPIKSNSKIYIKEVDRTEDFCVLKHEMRLDKEDTKKTLITLFNKMGVKGEDLDKALNEATLEINDNNTYEYYYYPGVPHRIESIRESIINIDKEKGKRIDSIIIELVYQE